MPVAKDESETTESTSIEKIHYEISKLPPPSKKFKLKGKKAPKIKFYSPKKTLPKKAPTIRFYSLKKTIPKKNRIEMIHYEISKFPSPSKKFRFKGKKAPKIRFYSPKKTISKKTAYTTLSFTIIGILVIILGLLCVLPGSPGTQPQAITLAIIGIIIIFFIPAKKLVQNEKDNIIVLGLIIWVIASYFITYYADREFLFILILVGILVIAELTQGYVSKNFQKRLQIMVFILIIIFLLIIAEKIAIILHFKTPW